MEGTRSPRLQGIVLDPAPAEPALALEARAARASFRPRRALHTLRRLIQDPDSTENALEVVYAIGTGDTERGIRRLARAAEGRRLLAARPSLLAALSDRDALARMPEDSLGRAYLAYLDRTGFEAGGLVALEGRVRERWVRDEGYLLPDAARAWFRDRMLLVHDLEHVLTGYGTDEVGEATLLAFDFGQAPGFANALLTFGAAFEVWRSLGRCWLAYAVRAWRRGRRARLLVALPFETLLTLPLDTVRGLAAIDPASRAHPAGVLRRGPSAPLS